MAQRAFRCVHVIYHSEWNPRMQVLLINNMGSGFADYVEVAPGTNIAQFLAEHLSGHQPGDLLIRVNRLPVARDQVLQDGDRISATPTKIAGAMLRAV